MSDELSALKKDGLDFVRTEIQRELRKYRRRMTLEAEAAFEDEFKNIKAGEAYDPEASARRAVKAAAGGMFKPVALTAPVESKATEKS
jgi:hypothetical protein